MSERLTINELSVDALRTLLDHAIQNGTVERWARGALEWAAHADREINRLAGLYHEAFGPTKCHVCSTGTWTCCSNCAVNFGAKVYVCSNRECREAHERMCWGDQP